MNPAEIECRVVVRDDSGQPLIEVEVDRTSSLRESHPIDVRVNGNFFLSMNWDELRGLITQLTRFVTEQGPADDDPADDDPADDDPPF